MEIEQVTGSYRLMVKKIRAMRNRHPTDAELQGLAADVLENMVESLLTLNELYHYKDPEEVNGDGTIGNGGGE